MTFDKNLTFKFILQLLRVLHDDFNNFVVVLRYKSLMTLLVFRNIIITITLVSLVTF